MGLNLALNAREQGYIISGMDMDDDIRRIASENGFRMHGTLTELAADLGSRKIVWVMVPAGRPTDDVLRELSCLLAKGDIVIDGGNTNYQRSKEHAAWFAPKEIAFLDVGTSGGKEGARHGACLMIGGDANAYDDLEVFFKAISVENGVLYCGPAGSGHYLKMVHNGIEYGMMQAIGEGFEILKACEYDYDTIQVSKVWNHGSVIRGWLMELAYDAFQKDPKLHSMKGYVEANGEGEWTVQSALDLKVPAPVITLSVLARYRSQQEDTYAGKVVAALRNEFGGHSITKNRKE